MREHQGLAAAAVLIAAALVAAVFFFSFWARNAPGFGRHDMGLALALSFTVPIALYASLALGALSVVAAILARKRGRAPALWLAALAVSLLPLLFLAAIDLLRPGAAL